MTKSKHNTAILIFSRTEKEEAIHKRFLSSNFKHSNRKIAHALIQNTILIAKKSKIRYYVISSNLQQGHSFGERFSHAIETVFSQGFNNIIAIGNDCPELSTTDLLQAEENFLKNTCTIGPENNGGVYLIGIQKNCFDPVAFKTLNWQSESLLSDLKKYLVTNNKPIDCLTIKKDVNSYKDLLRFTSLNPKNELALEVNQILEDRSSKYIHFNQYFRFTEEIRLSSGLRAPPLAA